MTRTVTVKLPEDVARFLDLLPEGAAGALAQLATSAAEGSGRVAGNASGWPRPSAKMNGPTVSCKTRPPTGA